MQIKLLGYHHQAREMCEVKRPRVGWTDCAGVLLAAADISACGGVLAFPLFDSVLWCSVLPCHRVSLPFLGWHVW